MFDLLSLVESVTLVDLLYLFHQNFRYVRSLSIVLDVPMTDRLPLSVSVLGLFVGDLHGRLKSSQVVLLDSS